jgi:cytoskeleton protein RodZ
LRLRLSFPPSVDETFSVSCDASERFPRKERHVSIGQSLTAARESAGMSVAQVSDVTRIRRTLVTAIENDDFALCGGDVYARGHLRTIAATIGLDPTSMLTQFDAEHERDVSPRAADVFEPDTASPERRGPNWSAAMVAALVLVVGYGVVQAVRGGDTGGGAVVGGVAARGRPSVAASQAAGSNPAKPAPRPSAHGSAVAAAPRDRVTVVLRAKNRSWVQATTASGKELFQGLLNRGQVKTFSDRQRVRLVVGNAGAVLLRVNGTDVGAPGRPGQVARVQFTPQDPVAG